MNRTLNIVAHKTPIAIGANEPVRCVIKITGPDGVALADIVIPTPIVEGPVQVQFSPLVAGRHTCRATDEDAGGAAVVPPVDFFLDVPADAPTTKMVIVMSDSITLAAPAP